MKKQRYVMHNVNFSKYKKHLTEKNIIPHMIKKTNDIKKIKMYWLSKIAELLIQDIIEYFLKVKAYLPDGKQEDVYFYLDKVKRKIEVKNTIIHKHELFKKNMFEWFFNIPITSINGGGYEQIEDICSQSFIKDNGETFDFYFGYFILKSNEKHIKKWSFPTKTSRLFREQMKVKNSLSIKDLQFYLNKK